MTAVLRIGVIGENAAEFCRLLNEVAQEEYVFVEADNAPDVLMTLGKVVHPDSPLPVVKLEMLPVRLAQVIHQLSHVQVASSTREQLALTDNITLDVRARRLLADKDVLNITELEVKILSALYHAPSQTLTKDKLLEAAWGYGSQISTNTLETHIYRLRTKLRKNIIWAVLTIEAVSGGYQLGQEKT